MYLTGPCPYLSMSVAPLLQWPQSPRRIAVFRPSRPSGLLRTVPALRALREAFSEASITLVSTDEAEAFVQRFHRYLDDLLVYPGPPNRPHPVDDDEMARFYAEANACHFDMAIQLQDSADDWNRIVARLGTPYWAGFVANEEQAAARFSVPEDGVQPVLFPWPRHLPEIERYTALLQHLGIVVRSNELEVPLTERDHKEAAQLFQSKGLNPSQTVVLHPGALLPEQLWPAECYARLAEELVAHGWQIAIAGREDERPRTRQVREAMRNLAMDLTGATHSGSYAAMLAKCRLLVCNEPSVSHVALAVHTPSIVLASGSDPNRWWLPNPELHTVLWPQATETIEDLPGSYGGVAASSQSKAIAVERVLTHARHKLGMGGMSS